ncbi:hypothetical protein I3760_03G214000 [Carya illinoinensis]|uniref:Oxidative stress 3 n=1 Tax=Carya illinoinensis TaxID=32201 RepID=A0A8T1R5K3_CARIL|nr:uncharacterized protein LOC122304437 [Carya illinoinensis]KAG2718311.1 hypothetical protein I3760_03G214000 [Carya illinoinensis]KAG6662146.1 hypothetical protein CIPAW_03G222800 [Carya illinoinensis]KAG6723514.1 hypothetical protein I3842_03G212000 [Carya illinoinensis]
MGEQANSVFGDQDLKEIGVNGAWHQSWLVMEGGDGICVTTSIESSTTSTNSVASSSSSELVEDASSSTSYSSSSSSLTNGPLYELSEIMVHLPVKRGLSKHYQGKSESFTSLASVKSLEDLSKRGASQRKKLKSCTPPKAIISKKVSRGSLLSSLAKRGGLFGGFRPSFHAQKEFLICKPREV